MFEVSPSVLTQARSRPCRTIECLADDTLVQTRQGHAAISRRCSSHFDKKIYTNLNILE